MSTESIASHGNFERSKEALTRDLKRVVRDADDLLSEVGSISAERFAQARGKVETRVGEVKVRLAGTRDAVAETARQTADATVTYVKDNPWKVVGIATVIGLIAGLLTTRR